MNIFLHRDDLRLHDNKGLKQACEKGETVPVYNSDPRIEGRTGVNKKAFRQRGLKKLDERYREKGSGLVTREGKTADELEGLAEELDVSKIFYNRSYTPSKLEVEREIERLDIETRGFKDRLLVEPAQLGQEYDTFSPFYSEWKRKEKEGPFGEPENLAGIETGKIAVETEPEADIPEAGEQAALERWSDFRKTRLDRYKYDRDNVGEPEAVSRLSMYYSSGMLGLRKVLDQVEDLIREEDEGGVIRNYAKYRNELAWREFFYQVLWHNPEAVNRNYKDFKNSIDWRNDEKEFKAWKNGETGVPFVDAGIRELLETGYMHNRTRQNVASFLTKHLMVDWRKGARFFRQHLVDHDTASNNGGWQWAASTGTDSVPVRIFNPVKQGRKYDEDAKYIKRWIPELRDLDSEKIHGWVEMEKEERKQIDVDYPAPIIDFNRRYHEGKKMFEDALGK